MLMDYTVLVLTGGFVISAVASVLYVVATRFSGERSRTRRVVQRVSLFVVVIGATAASLSLVLVTTSQLLVRLPTQQACVKANGQVLVDHGVLVTAYYCRYPNGVVHRLDHRPPVGRT